MRGNDLETRLAQAVTHATPDVLDRILSSCDEQKGTVIPMTTTKKRRYIPMLAAVAAMLVLCFGIFGVIQLQSGSAADSIVLLDVNPSISLTVSAKEKVLTAEALNEDGEAVLSDLNLKNVELTTAVNAIIGSMLQKGYLSDLQNAILVSVENDDQDKAAQLEALISQVISNVFSDSNLESAVLTQTVTEDETITQLAAAYSISVGKAALIQALIQQDETLTADNLAALTINDLTLICQSRGIQVDSLSQTGEASTLAYIGEDAALTLACENAGVSTSDLTQYKVKFDSDDGVMVYDVEFTVGDTSGAYVEYEYEINALTGDIVSFEQENKGSSGKDQPSTSMIDAYAAQEAALNHAGLTASQVTSLSAKLDGEDGVYDVDFKYDNTKYEYEIDAYTGAVVSCETEKISSGSSTSSGGSTSSSGSTSSGSSTSSSGSSTSGSSYIGAEAAQAAALAHAGLTNSGVKYIHSWIKYDHNQPECYKVEFGTTSMGYSYEIDLYTGAVLGYETYGHGYNSHGNSYESSSYIGNDAAQKAALDHAGLTASQVSRLEVELDKEDGVYEVEFKYNNLEYEYEINAYTGAVVQYDIDD